MTLVWYLVQSVCQPYTMSLHHMLCLCVFLFSDIFVFRFVDGCGFCTGCIPTAKIKQFLWYSGAQFESSFHLTSLQIRLASSLNEVTAKWVPYAFTLYSLWICGVCDPKRGRRKWYLTLHFPQFQNSLYFFSWDRMRCRAEEKNEQEKQRNRTRTKMFVRNMEYCVVRRVIFSPLYFSSHFIATVESIS